MESCPLPEKPVAGVLGWQSINQLLETGQYDQVAELLQEAWAAAKRRDDAALVGILTAAHQICRTCHQYSAETESRWLAYEEAVKRERELKQQLQGILELLGEQDRAIDVPGLQSPSSAPPATALNPYEQNDSQLQEGLSLWQRVQGLLGWGASPLPPDPEASSSVSARHNPSTACAAGEATSSSSLAAKESEKQGQPTLAIYCLGAFRVYQNDQLLTDWNGQKSQLILKYLVTHRSKPMAKDILMDVFWPDADPESARNNLNVAIYSLRQVFRSLEPDFSYILFQDDCYVLNPAMEIWVDVEEFVQRCEDGQKYERKGKLEEAMSEYGIAEGLYQGDFLEEDLYEDWIIPRREGLKDCYLDILERLSRYYLQERKYAPCIRLCRSILAKDDCREDAHRRLMRCYGRQGQRNLALRHYHLCVETLARVLDVPPTQETVDLYQRIRNGEMV